MGKHGLYEDATQFASADACAAGRLLPFDDYLGLSHAWLARQRPAAHFAKMARLWGLRADEVVDANAPFCWHPSGQRPAKRAVLLVHGFLESPYVVRDAAQRFLEAGYAVYAPLLPGHGTQAQDLEGIRAGQWLRMARYAYDVMASQHEACFMVGVSLGALLTLRTALQVDGMKAACLISPALGSRSSLVKYAEWFNYLKAMAHPALRWRYGLMQDYAKYAASPVNGIAQCMRMMHQTERALASGSLHVPLMMMLSMDDETINPKKACGFMHRYQGEKKLLLYARNPVGSVWPYATYRCSAHHDIGVLSQSHLGLQIAPHNPHYGLEGDHTYYKHYGLKGLRLGRPRYQGSLLQWKQSQGPYARVQCNPEFDDAMARLLAFFDAQL
jgi:carboxylesterase